MNILFHIANGFIVPTAMFFAWNFYKFRAKEINFRRLWISASILCLTTILTSLQFVFPVIIEVFNRNRDALLSGEIWRLITPLFIQPMGKWQCVINGLFFVSFVPIGEHLFGRSLLLIYFVSGIVGQVLNLYWETTPGGLSSSSGGSSTAIYGVIGALFMYILFNREIFPKGYILIPIAGFAGAAVLYFFEDGHAPSLIAGGLLGLIVLKKHKHLNTSINQIVN